MKYVVTCVQFINIEVEADGEWEAIQLALLKDREEILSHAPDGFDVYGVRLAE